MTKKEIRAKVEEIKAAIAAVPDAHIGDSELQLARVEVARAALAALDDDDLHGVLLAEIDRRRLGPGDIPKEPRQFFQGLYNAATAAIGAICGQPQGPIIISGRLKRPAEMVQRLSAVGLGALVTVKDQDTVGQVREIQQFLEALDATRRKPVEEKAASLARWLSDRFEREVSVETLEPALQKENWKKRLTLVAMAVGIHPGDASSTSDVETAYDQVRNMKW